jgi:hypothetical protein
VILLVKSNILFFKIRLIFALVVPLKVLSEFVDILDLYEILHNVLHEDNKNFLLLEKIPSINLGGPYFLYYSLLEVVE